MERAQRDGCLIGIGALLLFILIPGLIYFFFQDYFISEYCPMCDGHGECKRYSSSFNVGGGVKMQWERTYTCKECEGTGVMSRARAKKLRAKLEATKKRDQRIQERRAKRKAEEKKVTEEKKTIAETTDKKDIGKKEEKNNASPVQKVDSTPQKDTQTKTFEIKKRQAEQERIKKEKAEQEKKRREHARKKAEKEAEKRAREAAKKAKERKKRLAREAAARKVEADKRRAKAMAEAQEKRDKSWFDGIVRTVTNYQTRIDSLKKARKKAKNSQTRRSYKKQITRTEKNRKDIIARYKENYQKEISKIRSKSPVDKKRIKRLKSYIRELDDLRRRGRL